jgi:hypothetical protein
MHAPFEHYQEVEVVAKEDKGKVKMTVIHFETESDNATLQANIHAIAQTLTRALAPPPRVVRTPAQLAAGNGAAALDTAPGELEDFDDVIDIEPTSVSTKPKTGKVPTLRQPQPVELDLISGEVPLKAFLEKKNPTSDVKRYLSIAYWLKEYRGINEITMDHAYTCYRHMGTGWNVPKDASAPLRQMKTKRYGWMASGSTPGSFAINHLGENEVNNMSVE